MTLSEALILLLVSALFVTLAWGTARLARGLTDAPAKPVRRVEPGRSCLTFGDEDPVQVRDSNCRVHGGGA